HRLADTHKQLQTLSESQPGLIAKPRQRQAVNQVHNEERLPRRRQTAVEHMGDVRVIHQSQRLPLLLETKQNRLAVHPSLDQLERDLTLDRLHLLYDPDFTHAALANLLDQAVSAGDY